MGPLEIITLLLILMTALYAFMILAFAAGLVKILSQRPLTMPQQAEFVSVIIPVRNEEDNMLRILEEIYGQDYASDRMEIIIADDSSSDGTMELAGQFAAEHNGFPLILVPSPGSGQESAGKKRAIERGVARARGEILLFTDADTHRLPGWISSMVSGFGLSAVQMVFGPVYFSGEKNLLQRIQSLEFLGLMGTTAGSAALGCPVMCNGANLAYRREAFFRTGGFTGNLDYLSGDDQFMMSAIRKQYGNRSLVFNSDPVSSVGTVPEATLAGFLNQRIRWVSKSRGYKDPVVIMVGLVTWLTHLLLLSGILMGIFNPGLLLISVSLWVAKMLIDYPIVWMMKRYFRKNGLNGYYFIAQVFQLVYVPLAGLLGLFLPYRWKGRRASASAAARS